MTAVYRIRTYDWDIGEYTAQAGVPEIACGISGLAGAIRSLRSLGYSAHCNASDSDPNVLIERYDVPDGYLRG